MRPRYFPIFFLLTACAGAEESVYVSSPDATERLLDCRAVAEAYRLYPKQAALIDSDVSVPQPREVGKPNRVRVDLLAADQHAAVPSAASRPRHHISCWFEDQQLVSITHNGQEVALNRPNTLLVFFDWDKATLTPQGRTIVGELADRVAAFSAAVTISGHADTSGSATYNTGLSLRRAHAVRDASIQMGVPRNRMQVTALGETQPLVETGDGVREPQNRRVEINLGP